MLEEDPEESDEEDEGVINIKCGHDGEPFLKNIRSGGAPVFDLHNPPKPPKQANKKALPKKRTTKGNTKKKDRQS